MRQGAPHVIFRVNVIIIGVHGGNYLIHHLRTDVLHIRQISHVVDAVFFLMFADLII